MAALGFMALLVVGFVIVAIASRSKRQGLLAQLAPHLGGQAGSNDVRGTVDGTSVHLHFETRGAGSSSTQWTYIDCALPPGYPLSLHVEEHRLFDRGKIARGEMVDVEVGHPAFDQRFRVEAAPAEVIRQLLTEPVCDFLLRQRDVELETTDGLLRLAIRGWLGDAGAAQEAIAVAVAVARGVRPAHLASDDEVARPIVGGVYRGHPDDAPVRAAHAARAGTGSGRRSDWSSRPSW